MGREEEEGGRERRGCGERGGAGFGTAPGRRRRPDGCRRRRRPPEAAWGGLWAAARGAPRVANESDAGLFSPFLSSVLCEEKTDI